jgi:rubrerythrin
VPAGIPPELESAYRSLVKDVRLALLSEIGARAAYYHLAQRTKDEELRELLLRLNQDGAEVVKCVQQLMREMGGRPRNTSFRRRALARILAQTTRLSGMRPALRLCHSAEETVSRWYAEYGQFLVRIQDLERARLFQELSVRKRRNASALGAWITNLRGR